MPPEPITGRVCAVAYDAPARKWDVTLELSEGRLHRFAVHEHELPADLKNIGIGDIFTVRPALVVRVVRPEYWRTWERPDPYAEGGAK